MADSLTTVSKNTSPPPDPTPLATYILTKSITLDGDLLQNLLLQTGSEAGGTDPTSPNVINDKLLPDAGEETIITINLRAFKRTK